MDQDSTRKFVFPKLGYANCWEDGHVLCEALCPGPGKRILSIASGGDNAFALAAKGATVVAVDRNPSQLACMDLKRAALSRLEYREVLEFFGLSRCRCRREVFRLLEPDLSDQTRAYWNGRLSAIDHGFIHSGKFEQYFRYFRRYVLPLIHSRSVMVSLFEERTRAEREQFFEEVWDNSRWRALFRIFFSRTVMSRLGRDAAFFRYVDGSVRDHVMAVAHHAMVELPTHTNPFLNYIVTGTFRQSLPRYLQPDRFQAVREGLGRVSMVEGQVEEAAGTHAGDGFDGFNLSDLFEYMNESAGRKIHAQLLRHARTGARVAYWNMMAPRRFARGSATGVVERTELADALHASDHGFFYRAFVLEEVSP
jgi:S-adenosylmethionine-diacylglycerol 3-amino-3-carboxypropyl transferase